MFAVDGNVRVQLDLAGVGVVASDHVRVAAGFDDGVSPTASGQAQDLLSPLFAREGLERERQVGAEVRG